MPKAKVGRGGDTVVRELGGGKKVSITDTPAGVRVNLHDGGVTRPVDPGAYGVSGASSSKVGGGAARVTVNATDGKAIDYTSGEGRRAQMVVHDGGASRPKK